MANLWLDTWHTALVHAYDHASERALRATYAAALEELMDIFTALLRGNGVL